jgi:hypothetical protein
MAFLPIKETIFRDEKAGCKKIKDNIHPITE